MMGLKRGVKSLLRSAGVQASRVSTFTNDEFALNAMLKDAGVDLLLDVGANEGQYAKERFEYGCRGRIVSFEPLSAARRVLMREAEGNPNWTVADLVERGRKNVTRFSWQKAAASYLDHMRELVGAHNGGM